MRWWLRVVAAFALAMPVVMVTETARADWQDNVRDYVDQVLNAPGFGFGSSGGIVSGQSAVDFCQANGLSNCEQLRDPQASAVNPDVLATVLPGVAPAVEGESTTKGGRKFLPKCKSRATCVSLGLGSIAALWSAWTTGVDGFFDLFESDEVSPVPQGSDLLDSKRSEPNPHAAEGMAAIEPMSSDRNGDYVRIRFQASRLGWVNCVGGSCLTTTNVEYAWECTNGAGLVRSGTFTIGASFQDQDPPTKVTSKTLSGSNACGAGWDLTFLSGLPTAVTGGFGTGVTHLWHAGVQKRPESEDTFGAEVECAKSDGSTYTASTVGQPDSLQVPIPRCSDGDNPIGVEVGPVGPNGVEAETKLDLSPGTTRTMDPEKYAECVGEECRYRVHRYGQPCYPGQVGCTEWTRDPENTDCFYGPYKVARALCYPFERYYQPDAGTVTPDGPNTDGDPDTFTGTPPQPEPEPTTTPGAPPIPDYGSSCGTSWGLGPVQPETAALVETLATRYNIKDVGGYRESDPVPDHPSGLAADFMTYSDTAKGTALANYAVANAAALGVDYVMWDSRIWSQARSAEGWRTVADRGSPTANHEDHVHITVTDVAGTTRCDVAPDGDPETTSSECFPSGWSAFNPVQWVLKPTKCALEWAFVPDGSKTEAQVSRVKSAVGATGVAEVLGAASDRVGELGGDAAGCKGPGIRFDVATVDRVIYPFNACTEPISTAAHYAKALTTVVLVVGGGLALVRAVASGFGFNFSTRAGGGGSNGD